MAIMVGTPREMQKERSIWSKLKKMISGAVNNEVPVYGEFRLVKEDGYDMVVIKLGEDTPLDSLRNIMNNLGLQDDDVWFTGEVKMYV
jgi:methanogenic corrinoid protein MtbC1